MQQMEGYWFEKFLFFEKSSKESVRLTQKIMCTRDQVILVIASPPRTARGGTSKSQCGDINRHGDMQTENDGPECPRPCVCAEIQTLKR